MFPAMQRADVELEHFDTSSPTRDAQGRVTTPSSTVTVRSCPYGLLTAQEMFDLGIAQQQRVVAVRMPTSTVVQQGDNVTLPAALRLGGKYSVQSVRDTAIDRRVLCIRAVS